jgi:uncharacterized protein
MKWNNPVTQISRVLTLIQSKTKITLTDGYYRKSSAMRPFYTLQLLVFASVSLAACSQTHEKEKTEVNHPAYYFEIPVTDMDRAIAFYETVLGTTLKRDTIDGYEMALFPFAQGAAGATGALAKGDVYRPSKEGAVVYFHVDDIKAAVAKAEAMGRPVLYPVKDIGEAGLVAEVEDTEGNRLALSQQRPE